MKWCFILLLTLGCAKKNIEPPPPPSFPIKVARAEQKNAFTFLESLGHVDPITSIQIRSRIEGELTGVFFEQGK